jgi:hypothetical protein
VGLTAFHGGKYNRAPIACVSRCSGHCCNVEAAHILFARFNERSRRSHRIAFVLIQEAHLSLIADRKGEPMNDVGLACLHSCTLHDPCRLSYPLTTTSPGPQIPFKRYTMVCLVQADAQRYYGPSLSFAPTCFMESPLGWCTTPSQNSSMQRSSLRPLIMEGGTLLESKR